MAEFALFPFTERNSQGGEVLQTPHTYFSDAHSLIFFLNIQPCDFFIKVAI